MICVTQPSEGSGHPAGPIYDGAWCEYEADGNLPVALDDDA